MNVHSLRLHHCPHSQKHWSLQRSRRNTGILLQLRIIKKSFRIGRGDKTRYSDGGPPARWSGHFTRVSCSVCSAARITNTPALLVRGGTQPATVRGCRSHTHSAGQIAPILMIIDPRSKRMEENEKASCSYQRARQGRTRRWKCRIGNDG